MSQKPEVGSKEWIKGGRAYGLAKLAGGAILLVKGMLVLLVVTDKYTPDLNNLFLMAILSLAGLGGLQQIPNIANAARKKDGEG